MNITIRQRENKKWQAIISYKNSRGKWLQKSQGGFEKKKEANLWAQEMSFELKKLEKSGVLGNEYTLQEVFDIYMGINFPDHKNLTTRRPYYQMMVFFKDFKNRSISDIRPKELLDFVSTKRRETGLTYNMHVAKLSTMFLFAIKKLRACEYNPCNIISRTDFKEDERIKFISEELYIEILKSMKTESERLLIKLLYETGMRISEALGVCTQNVVANTIIVDKQYIDQYKLLTDQLKTKNSYRTTPISHELYMDLKKKPVNLDGRIFYDVKAPTIRYRLKKFNTSPHCFRHTRATILVSSGIDLTVVSYVIGDTIETILKTYVDVNENDMDKKFELIRQTI